jgi:hypothetical protein
VLLLQTTCISSIIVGRERHCPINWYNWDVDTIRNSKGRMPPRWDVRGKKIRFFGVKLWFITRNTPKIFAPPSTIGKNMIFWRKIVIFHMKYPKYFRTSLHKLYVHKSNRQRHSNNIQIKWKQIQTCHLLFTKYWTSPFWYWPPKIGKNKIFWRKIVIYHTKYPQNFRASLHNWKKYDFLT